MNILNKKNAFLLVILLGGASYLIPVSLKKQLQENEMKLVEKVNLRRSYPNNNHYVTNNNIALYSSYIIVKGVNKQEIKYTIETIIEHNWKNIKNFGTKDNFTCLVKYLDNDNNYEVIELQPYDTARINSYNQNRKLYFEFSLNEFELYAQKPSIFNLDRLVVAVIWKHDFSKSIEELNFMNGLNISQITLPIVLPYSYITYQKPEIIKTQRRLPKVAVCGAQFYGNEQKELFNWIEYQESFGVAEIMIYDGTVDRIVTKFINEEFSRYNRTKITMIPDQSLFIEQCNETLFYKQFDDSSNSTIMIQLLYKLCKDFFDWSHRSRPRRVFPNVGWSSNVHRIVVLNDCFIRLSKKYEFVAIYDFDEFIFPRTMHFIKDFYDKNETYSCEAKNQICSQFPFVFRKKSFDSDSNYLYNYLMNLLENESNGRNLTKFGGFEFRQAESFTRINEELFVDSLEKLVNSIDNSTIFPLYISANIHHIFKIERNDIQYINYLLKSYKMLIPCIYGEYLKTLENIDSNKIRALFYFTSGERLPKSIHHSKNTKSVNIHAVEILAEGSWLVHPSDANGHFTTHFRNEIEQFKRNFSGPIRQLNIDYEYLFFALKKYSSFCLNI